MTAVQRGRHGKSVVGVLTVIQEEFDAAKAALGANSRFKKTRYWHGDGGTDRFVLAKMPDRTNVPAAESARDMFEYWRPDVLVLVGIAGGLSSGDAGLGDVVVPDYLH
ncbi:MAG: adenosylhomocysteine nucleosidase [Solirubrobacteraceae bacterium]|jgi:nucleoside phosphorylase|nr:adenosylhomocysteine nucleosidase [Solirubrobacteraceae bacterium]